MLNPFPLLSCSLFLGYPVQCFQSALWESFSPSLLRLSRRKITSDPRRDACHSKRYYRQFPSRLAWCQLMHLPWLLSWPSCAPQSKRVQQPSFLRCAYFPICLCIPNPDSLCTTRQQLLWQYHRVSFRLSYRCWNWFKTPQTLSRWL